MTQLQIQQLPLEARNPVGLLSLQTGAVYLPTGDQRSGAVSGARSDQSNVTLDGIDVNDAQWSYAYNTVLRVTPESLQEFRVSTSNYTADMGRSSAAQVSLVTKSGTNQFNGAGYWSHRNTNWSSNEYFQKRSQLAQGLPSTAPKLDKHSFGGALGGPIKKDRFFFFGNYEGLREESESPVLRNVPRRRCATACWSMCAPSRLAVPRRDGAGLLEHPLHPGRQVRPDAGGDRSARPARHRPEPRGLRPLQAVPDAQRPRSRRHQLHGVPLRGAAREQFKTFTTRLDVRVDDDGQPQAVLPRREAGRRARRHAVVPRPAAEHVARTTNWGFAIGHDAVVSQNLVNTFRYGLTKIDETTLGLQDDDAVTFRFITSFEALSSTTAREVPTHNFVNDLSWLKGSHTVKLGTNIRFTRNPRFSNASSFHEGNLNPSWVSGTGRRYMPGSATCTTPGCTRGARGGHELRVGLRRSVADAARCHLAADGELQLRPRRKRASGRGAGPPEVRRRRVRVLRAGQLARPSEPDRDRRRPLQPLLAAVGNERPAGCADDIARRVVRHARREHEDRHPRQPAAAAAARSRGPCERPQGVLRLGQEQLRSAHRGRLVAARAKSGFLGTLTGEDQLVIRGGYSMLYDRVGFALATIFDQNSSFGMSTRIPATFGSSDETVPGARFVNLNTLPATLPAPPPAGFPATPPLGDVAIYSSLDDTITTPYHHVFNAVVGRELRDNFAIEAAYVGRRGRNLLIRRDMAMPLNLTDPVGHGLLHAPQAGDRRLPVAGIATTTAGDYTGIPAIAYWENLFPGAAGTVSGVALTATQRIARLFFQNDPDFSSAIFSLDTAARRRAASTGRTRSSTASSPTWRRRARSRGPTTTRCS